jgi:PAS domain S-box-containing protein
MNNLNRQTPVHPAHRLTVSYKAGAFNGMDSFLQYAPDVVLMVDTSFRIRAVNWAAERFLGQSTEQLLGQNLTQLVSIQFQDESYEQVLNQVRQSRTWSGDCWMQDITAMPTRFQTTVTAYCNELEEVSELILFNRWVEDNHLHQYELHETQNKYRIVVESLSEGVMLINADGLIDAHNEKASQILGCPGVNMKGWSLFNTEWNAIKIDGTVFPADEFPAVDSLRNGVEHNDVIMGLYMPDKRLVWLSINSRPITHYQNGQTQVVASFKDISSELLAWEKVKENELLFRGFMNNSSAMAWLYDEDGNLVYANPLFMQRIGIAETDLGKHISQFSLDQTADRILSRNQQVFETKMPLVTEDVLTLPDGTEKNFIANWFLVPGKKGMLVGGQAIDITEQKNAVRQLQLMHERFTYVVNASSDAIWDLDLRTNNIYRSDAFLTISGYSREEIESNLDWLFTKIHPEDLNRVQHKIDHDRKECRTNWEDEYRFLHKDGTYRHILDKGYTIYEDGVAIRQVGSMQDITEKKKLEAQLMQEQVQKQRLVNQATIQAQEHERNAISAELHDNVNQLLISSRLFIGAARNNKEQQDDLLEKATNYLLMAVDEIRGLSKRMNSKVVGIVGLKESITEIANNLIQHRQIDVLLDIDETVTTSLSKNHQLMVFRIVQEQTGNIVKHSGATEASISIFADDNTVTLIISDNGKGFDASEKDKVKGIGLINIFNRVDAYNGTVDIQTAPGKGCTLKIQFPFTPDGTI